MMRSPSYSGYLNSDNEKNIDGSDKKIGFPEYLERMYEHTLKMRKKIKETQKKTKEKVKNSKVY